MLGHRGLEGLAALARPRAPQRVELLRRDERQQIRAERPALLGVRHHEVELSRLAHHRDQQGAEKDAERQPDPRRGERRAGRADAPRPSCQQGPHQRQRGQDAAVKDIIPIAERDEGQEERRQRGLARDVSARTGRGHRAQQIECIERQPFERDELHVAEQVSGVVGRKGEDDPGRKGRDPAAVRAQRLPREQICAQPAKHKAEDDDAIVSRQQPPHELDRQGHEAVERVQRVEQQADAGRVVEQVGEPGVRVPVEQRDLDPPQVPVVLPAVEAVAGDGGRELADQRIGQREREQQIAEERRERGRTAASGQRMIVDDRLTRCVPSVYPLHVRPP
ncbi:MAG: hypothetical protein BWY52_01726 [Chloroflexi bacterium ADurb.Bin325]|nr:MAG: hypothetical protein BWY52_01726 [Chloroflexi bacterium ADurb.Bin325]